jgi:hypothetical protein
METRRRMTRKLRVSRIKASMAKSRSAEAGIVRARLPRSLSSAGANPLGRIGCETEIDDGREDKSMLKEWKGVCYQNYQSRWDAMLEYQRARRRKDQNKSNA